MTQEKYRPSNATEGDMFMQEFCFQCAALNICKIIPKTMAYHTDDPQYPEQWIYDADGRPVCTSFAERGERQGYRCGKTPDLFAEGA